MFKMIAGATLVLSLFAAAVSGISSSPDEFTPEDVKRLARHLGIRPKQVPLLPAPSDLSEEELANHDQYAGYLTHGEAPCPYFHGRCTVHEARPVVCRNYGLHACALEGTFKPVQIRLRKRKRKTTDEG